MVKKIASFNLEEKNIGLLEQVSRKKAISKSEIVDRALINFYCDADELTPEQRYHAQRDAILKKCLDTLKLNSILMHEGGICEQIVLILALLASKKYQNKNTIRYGIEKVSLFEILNDVKDWDKNVFDKISSNMSEFKKIKEEYFNLYPK